MKRPLSSPSTTTMPVAVTVATALLLLGTTSVSAKHENNQERCPTVLSLAGLFDEDGSGGLSRSEFYDFIDGVATADPEASGNVTAPSLDEAAADSYDYLLCQCHYAFGHDKLCCDDTATDDEVVDPEDGDDGGVPPAWGVQETPIWREVSLVALDAPGDNETDIPGRKYTTVFCEEILWVIDKAGMVLANITDVGVAEDATATTTTATTDATEDDATSTTTTSTTTTSTATTSTSTTTAMNAASTQPVAEPLTLSFLGSTRGRYAAADYDFDDVNHAFWSLSLDVLRELNRNRARIVIDEEGSVVGDVKVSDPDRIFITHEQSSVVGDVKVNEPDGAALGGIDEQVKKYGGMKRRQLQWDFGEEAAVYFESAIMDVVDVDCPPGLIYANRGSPCLNFTNLLIPLPGGPLESPEIVDEFIQSFSDAVNNEGRLYDALVEEYPETVIVGLGDPGRGIPPSSSSSASGANQEIQVVSLTGAGAEAQSVQGSGFPAGGVIGAVFASIIVALAIAALVVKRRRKNRRELDDSNLSEDIEANEMNADAANVEGWLDQDEGNKRAELANSSLAAMGAASIVTTHLISSGKEMEADTEAQSKALVDASAVATRLSTGDTEVMIMEQQAWSRNEPVI